MSFVTVDSFRPRKQKKKSKTFNLKEFVNTTNLILDETGLGESLRMIINSTKGK